MPTADSFEGMPFMRPTLRMHCPSTLQRHTITGGQGTGEGKGLGAGAPAAQRLLSSQLIDDLGHMCIFMWGGAYSSACSASVRCTQSLPLHPNGRLGNCRHTEP